MLFVQRAVGYLPTAFCYVFPELLWCIVPQMYGNCTTNRRTIIKKRFWRRNITEEAKQNGGLNQTNVLTEVPQITPKTQNGICALHTDKHGKMCARCTIPYNTPQRPKRRTMAIMNKLSSKTAHGAKRAQ